METIRTVWDVAAVVRGRRSDVGLSQTALAEQAGVSRQWLSTLERGKASAEVGLVLRVLEVLGLDLLAEERSEIEDARHPVDLDLLLDEHRGPYDPHADRGDAPDRPGEHEHEHEHEHGDAGSEHGDGDGGRERGDDGEAR